MASIEMISIYRLQLASNFALKYTHTLVHDMVSCTMLKIEVLFSATVLKKTSFGTISYDLGLNR